MVTHETPGDTFWDKIKAGAEQAAKNTGIDAEVLQRPRPEQAGHADPERGRLQGRRHRHHAGDAGRPRRRGQDGDRRQDPGRRLQLGHRPVQGGRRADVLRLRRDPGRRRPAGERIADDGGQAPALRHPGRRLGGPRGPLRRRQERGARHREHPGQRRRRLRGRLGPAGQARRGQLDRLHRHARRPDRPRRPARRWTQAGSEAKLVTFDLNADAAQAIKDGKIQFSIDQQPYVQGYLAVPSLYLNMKNGNDIGGGGPVLTGPSFVDSDQHRRHPPVREEQHPLSPSDEAAGPPAGPAASPMARPTCTDRSTTHEPTPSETPPASRRPPRPVQPGPARAVEPAAGPPRDRRPRGGHRHLHLLPHRRPGLPVARLASSRCSTRPRPSASSPSASGMLMIGGEFDLSAGVIVTSAGLRQRDVLLPARHQPLGRGAPLAGLRLSSGFLNGYLVMRTGIPSFLITLGTFFVLQGANLGVTKLVTGSVSTPNINQMDGYDSLNAIFASQLPDRLGHRRRSPCSGGSSSWRSPAGSFSAPGSATGSTPSAATPPAPAPSVSPCARSRSACS